MNDLRILSVFLFLCSAALSQGIELFNPISDAHQRYLVDYVNDSTLSTKSSAGWIKSHSGSGLRLRKFLQRRNVELAEEYAESLHELVLLKSKGSKVLDTPSWRRRLVTAPHPADLGIKGKYFETLALGSKTRPFSKTGSFSSDGTLRASDGRVLSHLQLKVSLDPMSELWKDHFQRLGDPNRPLSGIVGLVPSCVHQRLRREGVVPDGNAMGAEAMRIQAERTVRRLTRSSTSSLTPGQVRELAGARCALGSPRLVPTLRVESSGISLATVDARLERFMRLTNSAEAPFLKPNGLPPDGVAGSKKALIAFGGLVAIGSIAYSAYKRVPPKYEDVDDVRDLLDGAEKSLRGAFARGATSSRALLRIVRGVRFGLGVYLVGVLAKSTFDWLDNNVTTREFSTRGASFIGAWGGAELGAQIGQRFGTWGVLIGGVVGGIFGELLFSKGADLVWQSFDSRERQFALEILVQRIRKVGG